MKRVLVSGVAALGLLATTPAGAATIVLNDLGGVGAGSDAYRGFTMAANFWAQRLTNDVVINLDVGFKKLDPGVLGQAGSNSAVAPIELVQGQLASVGNSKVDAIAVANLPGLTPGTSGWGAVDVTTSGPKLPTGEGVNTGLRVLDVDGSANNSFLDANSANLKALGFGGFGSKADGTIQFSNEYNFDFNAGDGVAANAIDFLSVAIHEIGHVLGFTSGVDVYDILGAPNGPLADDPDLGLLNLNDYAVGSVMDLFRYSGDPTGVGLDWSVGSDAFFSIDGKSAYQNGYFSTGAYNGDGRQASHWKDNVPGFPQLGVMDPTVAYGQMGRVTSLDLAVFDAIGWNIDYDVFNSTRSFTTQQIYWASVPEPSTWALLIGGFFMTGAMVRRRRAVPA